MNALDSTYARNHIYGLAHNITKNQKEQNELINEIQKVELKCIREGMENKETIRQLLEPIIKFLN